MESRPISILFLIDYFHRTGGTETHLTQLVKHLARENFRCEIIAFDLGANPLIDEIRAAGVGIHHLPVAREYTPHAVLQAWHLARRIRRGGFDIVQTFHQKSDTYGALVARLAGARHLVSSKRDTGHLRRSRHFFLNRRLNFLFEKVVVVADAVGKAVMKSDHLDRSRLIRIYNGVDTSRFRPASDLERSAAKARFGLKPEDFVVGMVAGFRPEKNHRVYFDGALAARPTIPSLKLLAVGGGPLLTAFQKVHGGQDSIVRFAGDVRDVQGALQAMDVGCLLPSSNEGFSNAVIEKMSAGLPMIVTNVGGNAEAVMHNDNGLVIPPADAGAFSRALIALHQDPQKRQAMGQRSRRLAEERFSLETMYRLHENLYRDLVHQTA